MFLRSLYLLLLAAGFVYSKPAIAQLHSLDIDSLKLVLKKEKPDSATFSKYGEIMHSNIGFTDLEAKLVISTWMLQHAQKKKQWYFVAYAHYMMGSAYVDNEDYVSGSKHLITALEYTEKYHMNDLRFKTWSMLVYVYYFNKQYDKARDYLKKTIAYALKTGNRRTAWTSYHNLGLIYFTTADTNRVQRDSALYFLRTAASFLDPEKEMVDIITFNTNISGFFSEMDMYDSALHYLNKTLPLIQQTQRHDLYILYYHKLGKTFSEAGQYNKAIKNYNTGLTYALNSKSATWVYDYYYELSVTYERMRDYRKAFEYYSLYHTVHDSVVNKENFAKAADIQNKYEREKNERIILQLNKNNEIKQLKIEKENQLRKKLYYIIAGVTLMGISLMVLVFYQIKIMREKRNSYNALQQKNIDIQHQSGQLAYQSRLIAKYQSQMNPHFIFNAINNIQGLVLTGNKNKSLSQLQNFRLLMQRTLDNSDKDYITLSTEAQYLHQYVSFEQARFEKPFAFTIDLPGKANQILIPPMIIQPFIENAIKHAALHTIDHSFIHVTVSVDHLLNISIRDNGKGFDIKKSNVLKKGHALDIIRSRIILFFKAENIPFEEKFFSVQSTEGSGTHIQIILPLKYA